jgi:hypothetical protein
MENVTRRSAGLLLLVSLLAAGCGGPYRTAPVSGRVTLNGKPLAGAAVTFQPVAEQGNLNPGPGSGGFTDDDGRYTLRLTGKDTPGAVVGKHKVRITLVPETNPTDAPRWPTRQLPRQFNRDTRLEVEVPPGGTSTADFDLKTP